MKKYYEKPSMELVLVELESAVLAASGDYEGDGEGSGDVSTVVGGAEGTGDGM